MARGGERNRLHDAAVMKIHGNQCRQNVRSVLKPPGLCAERMGNAQHKDAWLEAASNGGIAEMRTMLDAGLDKDKAVSFIDKVSSVLSASLAAAESRRAE